MVIDWSLRAQSDLTAIIDHIAPESPSGARRIAARILKRVEDLRQFPEQGVARPGGLYRLDVSRTPYVVIYRIAGEVLTIVTILHGRRQRRS